MWEYVKGSEADFEGVWISATHITSVDDEIFAVVDFDYMAQAVRLRDLYEVRISNPTRHVIIAERRKVATTTPTEALITERGNRYGEFKNGAAIMQQLKDVMHAAPKWDALKSSQKEALEMIQHKIGRILNGDPDYDDNWKDIAGYATLIVKELQ